MLEVLDFRLWGAQSRELSRKTPSVYTPPHDDFAGLAAYGSEKPFGSLAPQREDERNKTFLGTLVTRQACCLLCRMGSFWFGLLGATMLVYTFLGRYVVEHQAVLHCGEQPVQHGVILPGKEGSEPRVKCDEDYFKGAPLKGIKCRMISEHCVIKKHATVMKAAVQKCDRKYTFISKEIAEASLVASNKKFDQVMNPDEVKQQQEKQRLKLQHEQAARVPHACLSRKEKELGLAPSRLYGEGEPVVQLPKSTASRISSKVTVAALVAALVLLPLALLVTGGVLQGLAIVAKCRLSSRPPPAEDEAGLLDPEEDGIAFEDNALH